MTLPLNFRYCWDFYLFFRLRFCAVNHWYMMHLSPVLCFMIFTPSRWLASLVFAALSCYLKQTFSGKNDIYFLYFEYLTSGNWREYKSYTKAANPIISPGLKMLSPNQDDLHTITLRWIATPRSVSQARDAVTSLNNISSLTMVVQHIWRHKLISRWFTSYCVVPANARIRTAFPWKSFVTVKWWR